MVSFLSAKQFNFGVVKHKPVDFKPATADFYKSCAVPVFPYSALKLEVPVGERCCEACLFHGFLSFCPPFARRAGALCFLVLLYYKSDLDKNQGEN